MPQSGVQQARSDAWIAKAITFAVTDLLVHSVCNHVRDNQDVNTSWCLENVSKNLFERLEYIEDDLACMLGLEGVTREDLKGILSEVLKQTINLAAEELDVPPPTDRQFQ